MSAHGTAQYEIISVEWKLMYTVVPDTRFSRKLLVSATIFHRVAYPGIAWIIIIASVVGHLEANMAWEPTFDQKCIVRVKHSRIRADNCNLTECVSLCWHIRLVLCKQ